MKPTAQSGEWLPIATAPKDGCWILVYRPITKGITKIGIDYYDAENEYSPWVGIPTHWMPLPDPPKEAK